MLLHDIIKNNLYFTKISGSNKDDALMQMTDVLHQNGALKDKNNFYHDILQREEIASTFMENSVAIPHAKSESVAKVSIVLGISEQDIKNPLFDDENSTARIFFMLAVPNESSDLHLQLISNLAQFIINEDFCKQILQINSKDEFIALINKYSNEKVEIKTTNLSNSNVYDLVAVTACPVGIAHTYIAAEKLEKVAKEMGLTIKVQTNGSIGIKNALSEDEIKNAKAVILACDVDVEDYIFIGKKVFKCPVAKAIKDTKNVINSALNTTNNYSPQTSSKEKTSANGLGAYKHLLTGVSFMIPFVVIGGILIAAAIALSGISESGVNIQNDILKKMETLGAMSFGLMVPILAGYIGFSIAGKPALAPSMVGGALAASLQTGFLGGILIGFVCGYTMKYILSIPIKNKTLLTIMPILILPIVGAGIAGIVMYGIGGYIAGFMALLTDGLKSLSSSGSAGLLLFSALLGAMIAIDMGGPINKVAFLFGASMIAAGVPTVMGTIAVAVAVPPLGMALATFLSPKKYYEEEKQAGKAAFFMGLIGITEGAIPFAAADPLRVIPSIVVGSSIAGLVAGYLKVADHAPHGGPIVLPVVDNIVGFLIALCIGMIITALLVNTLKKTKEV
jgi:PTS system fructose-specific IIC component